MEVLDPPALAYGNILYTATITATYTVSDSNDPAVVTPMVLELLPSGAQRDVEFPRPSMPLGGRVQYVRNSASVGGYTLRIRAGTSASATLGTIATMQPGESGLCVYWQDPNDSIWKLRYFSLAFNAATTVGTLTEGITFAAGITKMLDASACATGEALVKIGDNLANAMEIKEGSNSYLKFVTTNSAESVVFGQPVSAASVAVSGALSAGATTITGAATTTDGVTSGTARKIGGVAANITTSGTLGPTGGIAETALATYTIPANTIKAGTLIRVTAGIMATAETGATTCTLRCRLGGTSGTLIVGNGAFDIGSTDVVMLDATIVGRAAPGAAASVATMGKFEGKQAGAAAQAFLVSAPANFATNGALDLVLTGQMSASDANAIACTIFAVEVVG